MAVPATTMAGALEESSSSDDEELQRCQEAVWETRTKKNEDVDIDAKPSKRVVVAEHEHDGNELQVTQGFRTHVAKKLGHLLDRCIAEVQTETLSCMQSATCDEDEGFRLFSTSVQGQKAEEPPAPVRRRPVPSSSDSDSEMETRLREAAVSVKDLLPPSAQHHTLCPPSADPPCADKRKVKQEAAEGGESHVVKKKKKRKQNQEEGAQVDSSGSSLNTDNIGEHGSSEREHLQVKEKQKKKKKRKEKSGDESVN